MSQITTHPLESIDLLGEVFSRLNPVALGRCRRVNKLWKKVAETEELWKAFLERKGVDEPICGTWKKTFDSVGGIFYGRWIALSSIPLYKMVRMNQLQVGLKPTFRGELYATLDPFLDKVYLMNWAESKEFGHFDLPKDLAVEIENRSEKNEANFISLEELSLDDQFIKLSASFDSGESAYWQVNYLQKNSVLESCSYCELMPSFEQVPFSVLHSQYYKENQFAIFPFSMQSYVFFAIWDASSKNTKYSVFKDDTILLSDSLTRFITIKDDFLFYCAGDSWLHIWNLAKQKRDKSLKLQGSENIIDINVDSSGTVFYVLKKKSLEIYLSTGLLARKVSCGEIDPDLAQFSTFINVRGKMLFQVSPWKNFQIYHIGAFRIDQ